MERNIKTVIITGAKIQLINEKQDFLVGFFLILDFFDQFEITKLIDNELKSRGLKSQYNYSDIVKIDQQFSLRR